MIDWVKLLSISPGFSNVFNIALLVIIGAVYVRPRFTSCTGKNVKAVSSLAVGHYRSFSA